MSPRMPNLSKPAQNTRHSLTRFAWLSIAAAVATITLKTLAWWITGSVGLLSDAAESVVNLAAAVLALLVLRWVESPADDEHPHGHDKAEYFAAGVEGALILLAAVVIVWTAVPRLTEPRPVEAVGVGLAIAVAASVINLVVARVLMDVGRRHRSLTLEADGRHLMTDVWTTIGVVAGVALAALTGWDRLDAVVALLVAANIVVSGTLLLRRSLAGLMDRALEPDEQNAVIGVLDGYAADGVRYHALRTRRAGRRAFITVHVLVPGGWTVKRGHDLCERLERDIVAAVPLAVAMTHLEPLEDPASYSDEDLDRWVGV